MQIRRPLAYILTTCIVIELLLFFGLCSLGQTAFRDFVWAPDTGEYERVALQFAETFTLRPSGRTLGYPLFLSLAHLIGGREYWMYVTIGAQLILNIIFTWGCWRLLELTVPAAGIRVRAIATLFFFWAGLGMAFFLLTDFLASFFFGVFLYGILFWRTRSSIFLSGMSLALATLTRPTFILIPFLLPIVVYVVGQFTSKIPWHHLILLTTFSFAATGVSVMRQYTAYGYIGPSPHLLTMNIEGTLYSALVKGQVAGSDQISYTKEFELEIEKRAGRRIATLSPTEEEKYATEIFREELSSHPKEVISALVKNFVQYLFVPVEANILKFTTFYKGEQTYFTYVRPILGVACLPIWLFALSPPIGSAYKHRMYYVFVMMFLFYVIGISSIVPFGGERIRFPMLAFMLPIAVWNVHCVVRYLRRWTETRSSNYAG